MIIMLHLMNDTDVRQDWNTVIDAAVGVKTQFYKRNRDFYSDFSYWGSAPNRKSHIPYVFKALFMGDIQKIGESIRCQTEKS